MLLCLVKVFDEGNKVVCVVYICKDKVRVDCVVHGSKLVVYGECFKGRLKK